MCDTIALSLILCSRNDRYMGNPVWRLQTALNYLAENVERTGKLDQVEVLVSDWGSEIPLCRVLHLNSSARKITSFLEIPPDIAAAEQRDSKFPEVLALNAAARRAKGEYIGRIDQDTLVTEDFFAQFFAIHGGRRKVDFALDNSFLFVGRRGIPYGFSSKCPSYLAVKYFVRGFRALLPVDGPHIRPWFDSPVGTMLLHRKLWQRYRGYDESLLYWGWMETNFGYRLQDRHPLVDLKSLIKYGFFHLEHTPFRTGTIQRRKNLRKRGSIDVPNSPQWGLSRHPLAIRKCAHGNDSPGNIDSGDCGHVISGAIGILGLWLRYFLLASYGGIRDLAEKK